MKQDYSDEDRRIERSTFPNPPQGSLFTVLMRRGKTSWWQCLKILSSFVIGCTSGRDGTTMCARDIFFPTRKWCTLCHIMNPLFSKLVWSRRLGILCFHVTSQQQYLMYQTIALGVELFSYVNSFFSCNKFACVLATWVKTLRMLWLAFAEVWEKEINSHKRCPQILSEIYTIQLFMKPNNLNDKHKGLHRRFQCEF